MPVKIISTSYELLGDSTDYYGSNAGDKVKSEITVTSNIYISSASNPLIAEFGVYPYPITSAGIAWMDEGFRVGDTVLCTVYSSGGSVVATWTATIEWISGQQIGLSSAPSWYDNTAGETIVIRVSGRFRQDVELFVNHVQNGQPGNDFSLIDGEATRILLNGVDALAVGGSVSGLIVGNQSGQFVISANITRVATTELLTLKYTIELTFVNSGIYDSSWFDSSDCLKLYCKMAWASISGEPYARAILILNEDANTGWFNQAFNSAVTNSSIISGITELDYSVPSTFDVVVDGPLPLLSVGAGYVSVNDSYYKNKTQAQQYLTMLIPTESTLIVSKTSFTNPDGAYYEIEINSVISVGTVRTINMTFTPSTEFTDFMNSREEGDRLFYLWVKCGNINHLAFADQLTIAPPVGGPLEMEESIAFADHSQNIVDTTALTLITDEYDTEDDLSYYGSFLLDKDQIYQTFKVRIEAFNTVTEEDFTLQETVFNFSGVQISNTGAYLLNESQTINPTLPTTSLKRTALFGRKDSLDTMTQYGVYIYYPVLLRWEYWLDQLNADVDFYPTQNKNWQQYSQSGDWILRLELELLKEGLAYTHSEEAIDYPYNNEDGITSVIEIRRTVDNNVVDVIPSGEILIVKSTHTLTTGIWNTSATWGMITAEPKEASPRWICSSVVPFDNNTQNPLTPLSGNTISIQYPSPNVAVMECYFDSNKINLNNGVKFTGKIKDKGEESPEIPKTTAPDDTIKTTSPSSAEYKTLSGT